MAGLGSSTLQRLEDEDTSSFSSTDRVNAHRQRITRQREMVQMASDAGFALGSFYPGPTTSQEADLCRGYLKQAREEIGRRLIEKVYVDGAPSKFWTTFAKRKFMNKAL